jgi:hypothetical protein
MFLDSISDGYNQMGPDPPQFYSENHSGLGYGIYLHATNVSVPQRISNVSVKHVYFRSFKIGLYINNERNPLSGEDGAFIQGNNFEYLCFDSTSYGINITRVTSASKDKCMTSFNRFDQIQFQTGDGSWWGGEYLTWSCLGCVDGTGNSFTNLILWDYTANHRGSGPAINFTSDSDHCFFRTSGCADSWFRNNGSDNTILLVGDNDVNLYIDILYIENIGYLIDTDINGICDLFHSNETGKETSTEFKDGSYLIDTDGDGDWELSFSLITGLVTNMSN